MFLQGNETTKSSISLSFCLAMASPFALNFHNGVKKLIMSHLNFYPLAVSMRQIIVSCFSEHNSDRNFKLEFYKNSTAICFSDKITTGKIETIFQLFRTFEKFRKKPKKFQSHLVYTVEILEESLEKMTLAIVSFLKGKSREKAITYI